MLASGSQRRYQEHYELLREAVHERFGQAAMTLVQVLCDHGPLTLREAADVSRSTRFSTTNHLSSTASGHVSSDGAKPTETVTQNSVSEGTGGENFTVATSGSSSRHGAILDELFASQGAVSIGQIRSAVTESRAQASTTELPSHERTLVDDVETKKAAILLVQHGIIEYSEVEKTYRVRLGYGLLHCVLFSAILRHVKQLHGSAGEKLVELVHEYGVLPCNALLALATQQAPSLHSAFAAALTELRASTYIVPVAESEESALASTAPPESKRPRRELTSPHSRPSASGLVLSDASMTVPCTINYAAILHTLRQEAITRLVQARIANEAAAKICSTIFANDCASVRSSGPDRADGFPWRADISKSLPFATIRAACDASAASETILSAVTSKLAMPSAPTRDGGPGRHLLVRSTSLNTPAEYRISYDRGAEILRDECCEQCVFSRHGVLGVRIVKRLLAVHILDDRTIAEECIATLTQTREVLCALMRDGVVRQQEVPLVVSVERPPKLSQFFWALEREQLENVVRMHLVKSLRHARLRLLHEQKKRKEDPQLGAAEGGADSQLRIKRQAAQQDAVERALHCTILALLNAVMVMDFF